MPALDDFTLITREQGAGGYTGGLLAMTSPTALLAANVDDGTASFTIGFTFNFHSVDYTTGNVNSNGHMTFGSRFSPYPNYQNNSGSAGANASGASYGKNVMAFGWWDDLRTAASTGYVRSETTGAAGSRQCVIEWNCYGYYNQNSSSHDRLNWQVILYETSNAIEFRYAPLSTVGGSPPRTSYSASIGVRGNTAAGLTSNVRGFFGTGFAGGGNNTTIGIANIEINAAGTVIQWPGNSNNTDLGYAYDLRFALAPTVTSVSPVSGPAAGGTAVTVTGTAFVTGATVTFGGVAATGITVVSDTSITCSTPAGTGTVDVVVTNPDSMAGTLAAAFTYVAAPVVAPTCENDTTMAEVVDGWTGDITVTVGASAEVFTPTARGSAISVMQSLLVVLRRVFDSAEFRLWATGDAKLVVVSAGVFEFAATGTTSGRLGMSGTLSGDAYYEFPDAYTGAIVPAYGVKIRAPVVQLKTGVTMATGSLARFGTDASGGGRMTIYDDLEELVDIEDELDDGGTFDVMMWTDNVERDMPAQRVRIKSTRLNRWGMNGSRARLVCIVQEVAE